MITADGVVAPFVRIPGADQAGSEMTGPCFNPAGDRLYFSSQRGPTPKAVSEILPGAAIAEKAGGITYEVTGPFRGIELAKDDPSASTTSPVKTLGQAGGTEETSGDGDDGGISPALAVGGGILAAGLVAGGIITVRRRRERDGSPAEEASTDDPT